MLRPFSGCLIAVLIVSHTVGCGGNLFAPNNQNDAGDVKSKDEMAEADDVEPDDEVSDAAEPDDAEPDDAIDDSGSPMFRGLSRFLSDNDRIDDDGTLRKQLRQADDIFSRTKARNSLALRRAGRQRKLGRRWPNIVLIVAGRLSPGQLGGYGGPRGAAPAIDRLADEGMIFSKFFASGPRSSATAWSITTGSRRRAEESDIPLMTLAEMMWQAGYDTELLGDWPDGGGGRSNSRAAVQSQPIGRRGFVRWTVLDAGGDSQNVLVEFPEFLTSDRGRLRLLANVNSSQGLHIDDFFAQAAVSALGSERRGRPLFLQIVLGAAGKQSISDLDGRIEKIVTHVRQQGLSESTIVLLTSAARAGLRVPLIAWGPGRIAAGTDCRTSFGQWDLLPTLADLAGAVRRPGSLNGKSMATALRSRPSEP